MAQPVDMSAVTSYLEEMTGQSKVTEVDKIQVLINSVKPKVQTAQKITIQKQDVEFLIKEFELEKSRADALLKSNGGDLGLSIEQLLSV